MKHILKTYVHDDAAFEENLVVYIYTQESLHNVHIYTTIYVQMAPNKTTGHKQLTTVICNPEITYTYVLQFWTKLDKYASLTYAAF